MSAFEIWTSKEHTWNADQSDYEAPSHDASLVIEKVSFFVVWTFNSKLKEHVDHCWNDCWSNLAALKCRPVSKPLCDNHNVHKPKEYNQKDKLSANIKKELRPSFEVDCIQTFECGAHQHLWNPQNDWDFHFERVHIGNLLLRSKPNWVHSERIDTVTIYFVSISHLVPLFDLLEAGLTHQLSAERWKIIVDQSAVCWENAHQQEQVSHWPNLSSYWIRIWPISKTQIYGKAS